VRRLKFEKGIPIPEVTGRGIAAVVRAIPVGESYVFPMKNRHAVWAVARRNALDITTRAVAGGTKFRCWRKS
jgi:hypothetical protein